MYSYSHNENSSVAKVSYSQNLRSKIQAFEHRLSDGGTTGYREGAVSSIYKVARMIAPFEFNFHFKWHHIFFHFWPQSRLDPTQPDLPNQTTLNPNS